MRHPRISFIGGIYHVTIRCNNKEFLFQTEEDFQLFLQILFQAKQKYGIQVYAYCITNNHVHLVIGTPEKDNLSKFMQYLNTNFAKAYNKKHGREGHFWRNRFGSTVIESETQLFNTIAYVELNMIRAGVVQKPEDWKYSSYHAHAHGQEDKILDSHELYLALALTPEERQEIYKDMFFHRMLEKGFDPVQKQPIFSFGIFLGSKSFVENLLQKYGEYIPFYKKHKAHGVKENFYSLLRVSPQPGNA
jgi:putative transposase